MMPENVKMDGSNAVFRPVMRVDVPATLKKMPHGMSIRVKCREFAPYPSVRNAIYRLNSSGENYLITPIDNGESYEIVRK